VYAVPLKLYVVPAQILAVVVEVLVGLTVNTKVAALSQPTLLVRCDT